MSEDKTSNPTEMKPSLLWAMYTKAPKPHEVVVLPVSEKIEATLGEEVRQFAMIPLSVEEIMACQAEADDFARKSMKLTPKEGEENIAFRSVFDKEVLIRTLWRACRDLDDAKLERKVFPAPRAMRMMLTLDQLSILGVNYARVDRMLSPIRFIMGKEEMDVFVARLVEGGKTDPLDWLSSDLLRELVRHLVSLIRLSPKPSGSPGTPDGPTTPREPEDGGTRAETPEEPSPMAPSEEVPSGGAPAEPDPRLAIG